MMADAPAPASTSTTATGQQEHQAPSAAPPPPRENISIAFSRSQYATPGNDHTIPGSKPGHRVLRMGRQHQPPDALYNHLTHGLVAPGGCVTTTASNGDYFHNHCPEPWNGTADHPSPPGGNYVLHTKNGGKRHYDEPTGLFSEPAWQPSKRLVGPVPEEERCRFPHRRGRGVYNLSDRWIHPDAADALARREEAVQRMQSRGGKAQVVGPSDHTLEELSLWIRTPSTASGGGGAAAEAAAPADAAKPAVSLKVGERKRLLHPHHADQCPINAALAPLTHPPPPIVLAEFNDDVLLPTIGYGVPPPRCTPAEADAVAQYHREKRVRRMLATQRADTSASGTRAADMQAVRELPNCSVVSMSDENVERVTEDEAAAAAVVPATTPTEADVPAEAPQVEKQEEGLVEQETEGVEDAAAASPAEEDAIDVDAHQPTHEEEEEASEAAAPAADVDNEETAGQTGEALAGSVSVAAATAPVAEEEETVTVPQPPVHTTDATPVAPSSVEDQDGETVSLRVAVSEVSTPADLASAASPSSPPPQPTEAAAAPAAAAPPAPVKRQPKTQMTRQSSAPVHAQQQQKQQQQQPQPPAPAPRPVVSAFNGVATSSAIASAAMAPYMAETTPSAAYDQSEAERVAMAAASLTPNTVLAVFRRGHENSHVNRMDLGSYSRYLLSTGHMPAVVLDATFHGEAATVGTVPRHTLNASGRGKSNESPRQEAPSRTPSRGRSPSPQHSGRLATASTTSPRRVEAFPRPFSADERPTSSGFFAGTVASSTVNIRRELTLVQAATLTDLNTVRQIRRRDPRHGKTTEEQNDYYYYNHRSKGHYVPHDPPADTVMLQYNHMYSFGDGSRFSSRPPGSQVLDVVPNPHAAGPRTFAESRGSAFPFTASQRVCNSAPPCASMRSRTGKAAATTAGATVSSWGSHQSQRGNGGGGGARSTGSGAAKGSSSLRTAKAVDLSRLHSTQCPRPRSIEEVMADQPQQYLCTADGVRGPLVHDIERDVEDGKLQWADVPGSMRHAMATATSSAAAISARYSQPAATPGVPSSVAFAGMGRPVSSQQQHRAGSLATAPNALENVMGQVRAGSAIAAASAGPHSTGGAAKAMSTAPPSPAAASVRAAAGDRDSEVGDAAAAERGPFAAALPAISRLNYTPQPTRRSNPSAFV